MIVFPPSPMLKFCLLPCGEIRRWDLSGQISHEEDRGGGGSYLTLCEDAEMVTVKEDMDHPQKQCVPHFGLGPPPSMLWEACFPV